MALSSAGKSVRWKERIGMMVVGHTFKQSEEFVFDYVLYPAAIAYWGSIAGGLVMTTLSAFLCLLYIRLYDWSKNDWFGIELLREVRDGHEPNARFARCLRWVQRKGRWAAFLFLTWFADPFVTTIYMRQNSTRYGGLSSEDWRIFWASLAISNVGWIALLTIVIESIKAILGWFGIL